MTLGDFEKILTLLLGWLLGLLSPALHERIRRGYRRSELSKALHAELSERRFDMAKVAFLFQTRKGSLPDDFLAWME